MCGVLVVGLLVGCLVVLVCDDSVCLLLVFSIWCVSVSWVVRLVLWIMLGVNYGVFCGWFVIVFVSLWMNLIGM